MAAHVARTTIHPFILTFKSYFLLLVQTTFQASAVDLVHVDDFEGGSPQNWLIGHRSSPNIPVNVTTGGPAGAGDNYLSYTSIGSGSIASRMLVFNRRLQWEGNYLALGPVGFKLDVRNAGPTPLNLRIGLSDSVGELDNWIATAQPVVIPTNNTWMSVFIPIQEGNFTVAQGSVSVSNVLADVESIRIFSSAAPAFRGDVIDATIHFDNLRLVSLPSLPRLSIEKTSGSAADVKWTGTNGFFYQVISAAQLPSTSFTTNGSAMSGSSELRQSVGTSSGNAFFQLQYTGGAKE
ncbi:MAG: hypothetical protein CMO80_06685 [Verrucomicrobiales bacterium]|nr:hypothetical protein [Verrucomicrobiales bacterium]